MAVPIAPLSVRWHRFRLAETDASDHASAACYRRPEHIGIEAVVMAELKFGDVERHVFGRHFVESAHYAALKERPETLNGVGMNGTDNVLDFAVVNHFVRERSGQIDITGPGIRSEQADLVGHSLPDKLGYARAIDVFQNASDDIALALYGPDYWRLVSGNAAFATFFVPVAVFVLPADPGLINLDNAAKLHFRLDEGRANLVTHKMCRIVAAEAHHALDLEGAHALLAGEHEMGDPEPVAERLLGVLKNRSGEAREPIALRGAVPALPVEGLIAGCVVQVGIAATRTGDALRPAAGDQVVETGFVVTDRKTILELPSGHLRDWFRALCHDVLPLSLSVGVSCHA